MSEFITKHVCAGIPKPYRRQKEYVQHRTFPAGLSVFELYDRYRALDLILPYLLDRREMELISRGNVQRNSELWTYGEHSETEMQDIWKNCAPQRWLDSLKKDRENWMNLSVEKLVEYFHECEVQDKKYRFRDMSAGLRQATKANLVTSGNNLRPVSTQHYYQQQPAILYPNNQKRVAVSSRIQQNRFLSQSEMPRSQSEGRQTQQGQYRKTFPDLRRQNPGFKRQFFPQQQYQQRAGGRGNTQQQFGPGSTGRGIPTGVYPRQGMSARMPRQEQAHNMEPLEEYQNQYQINEEFHQQEEVGRDNEYVSNNPTTFYMGDVEQIVDDIAGEQYEAEYSVDEQDQQEYEADDQFLAEEDEWTSLEYAYVAEEDDKDDIGAQYF
jgi:hypothetical protein